MLNCQGILENANKLEICNRMKFNAYIWINSGAMKRKEKKHTGYDSLLGLFFTTLGTIGPFLK